MTFFFIAHMQLWTWPEPAGSVKWYRSRIHTCHLWSFVGMFATNLIAVLSLVSVGIFLKGCVGGDEDASPTADTATTTGTTTVTATATGTTTVTATLITSTTTMTTTTKTGCDAGDAYQCSQTWEAAKTANDGDTAATCTALQTYATCILNVRCCSNTGSKLGMEYTLSQYTSTCTGSNAVTSPCTWGTAGVVKKSAAVGCFWCMASTQGTHQLRKPGGMHCATEGSYQTDLLSTPQPVLMDRP